MKFDQIINVLAEFVAFLITFTVVFVGGILGTLFLFGYSFRSSTRSMSTNEMNQLLDHPPSFEFLGLLGTWLLYSLLCAVVALAIMIWDRHKRTRGLGSFQDPAERVDLSVIGDMRRDEDNESEKDLLPPP